MNRTALEQTKMRVALIASPFISVPPTGYGGTELFIAILAEALVRLGVDVMSTRMVSHA